MTITIRKKLKWLLVSLAILGADIWVGFQFDWAVYLPLSFLVAIVGMLSLLLAIAMIGEYITEDLKSE